MFALHSPCSCSVSFSILVIILVDLLLACFDRCGIVEVLLVLRLHLVDELHQPEDIECGAAEIHSTLGGHDAPHFSDGSICYYEGAEDRLIVVADEGVLLAIGQHVSELAQSTVHQLHLLFKTQVDLVASFTAIVFVFELVEQIVALLENLGVQLLPT